MILFLNREAIFSRTPFDVHGKKPLSSCKHFSQHGLDAFHFNWMNILLHWSKKCTISTLHWFKTLQRSKKQLFLGEFLIG